MSTHELIRVEWWEIHRASDSSLTNHHVIAEKKGKQWQFFMRSTWDIACDEVPATEKLIRRARKELRALHRREAPLYRQIPAFFQNHVYFTKKQKHFWPVPGYMEKACSLVLRYRKKCYRIRAHLVSNARIRHHKWLKMKRKKALVPLN